MKVAGGLEEDASAFFRCPISQKGRTNTGARLPFTGVAYDRDGELHFPPLRGGAGRIWGTIAGAFFLEIIGNILTLSNVNVYLIGAVQGAIIIIAMLVQRSLSRRT